MEGNGPRIRRRLAAAVAGAVLLWLAAGLRTIDPVAEFGVVDASWAGLAPVRTSRSWALVPPGLASLTRYPTAAVELPLPGAEEAWMAGADGGRYGLQGSAALRIRPESWREAHASSLGRGLPGILLEAIRAMDARWPRRWGRFRVVDATLRREVAQILSSELDRRGVELEGLRLDALDPLTAAADEALRPLPEARVLLIGLDGADWQIIDELMARGRLPNLASLIRRGTRAKLLSINPMLSPVVWTTVATGVEPTRHGILDFLVPDPAGGKGQPVTSTQRRAATVWQVLSGAGVRVGVVGWWASWPADRVDGYLVSDRVAYQLFGYQPPADLEEGLVWPPEIYPEVRSRTVGPGALSWEEVRPYLGGTRGRPEEFGAEEAELLREFRTLLASGRTYRDIALHLHARFEPRFEAVYFEGTDTVGHLFMRYRPPRLPEVDAASFESFREMVNRYYETADRYVGDLLAGRGEDWTVMVLSDHGFVIDDERPRTTDSRIGHGAAADWHRRFGILVLSGARVRQGGEIDEATVYDIAPTILALYGLPVPSSWPGAVLAEALEPEFLEAHPVRFRADYPEDEALARQAPASGPDPAAREVLAKLETLGYLSPAEETAPSISGHNNAGVALLGAGRLAEAEAEFRAALEEEPSHPAVLVNLGHALRGQGRDAEAREVFRRALEIPAGRRAAGHELAQISMESGDLDGAERQLRQVLESEPGAAEVRTTLGLVRERRGDTAGAEGEYRRAAEDDPHAAVPRNNLGNLAKRAGRTDEAEGWYRAAIEADPYFMGSYNNLALIYQDRGEIQKAIELYLEAREKAPADPVVLNNLASLRFATGELAEARLLWEEAARIDPSYPSPLNNLAGLAIAEGRHADAEALVGRALGLDPDYGDARINLALILTARGDQAGARRELSRAASDPRSRARAVAQLGLLDLSEGELVGAIEQLLEARRLDPGSRQVLNALGEAYRLLGMPDAAAEAWRRSLEIDPAQPQIRERLDHLAPAG